MCTSIHCKTDGKIDNEGSYNQLMQQGALEPLLAECESEEQARKRKEEEEYVENSYEENGSYYV